MSAAITNEEFLEGVFPEMPDGAAAMVCSFAGDPAAEDRTKWSARPWSYGDRIGPRTTTNNYLAVSSFYPDPETGRYRRRKVGFARLHAVMLDDLGSGPGAKLPMRHAERLPVSALVETSPDNYQGWLFVEAEDAADSRELAERLIARMIDQGLAANTDPGMAGVTRYGRLPNGINGKPKYLRDGKPFRVRCVRWNPEFRYTVAEIAQAFGLDLSAPPTPARPAPSLRDAHRAIDSFATLLEVLAEHGLYQAHLGEGRHAITCPWIEQHTDRADSGTALIEPGPLNHWFGAFRCWHGHCEQRRLGDVYRFARQLGKAAA